MRIVYLSNAPIEKRRANAIQTVQMCEAFARLGHDVVLIADPGRLGEGGLRKQLGWSGRVTLSPIKVRSIKGYSAILAPLSARRALRWKPDIVYTRNQRAGALAALFGKNMLFEAHAGMAGVLDRTAFATMKGTGRLRGVVAISSALGQTFSGKVPTLVAHDGADVAEIEDVSEKWPAGKRMKVGYVGSGYPGKGADFVVRLAQRRPDIEFECVGPTVDQFNLDADLPPPNFHCAPRIAPAEVPNRLRGYDVLVAPYSSRVSSAGGQDITRWMSPLKVFEYMAAGRPVIASDLPVLREVLRDAENAVLCPPDDVEAWNAALDRLAASPEWAKGLAETAQRELIEHYTWTARAKKIVTFMENVLNERT